MKQSVDEYIHKTREIMIESYRYFDNPDKYDKKQRGRPSAKDKKVKK